MAAFIHQLLTPSPIMGWLIALFPAIVLLSGLAGLWGRVSGSLWLTLIALVATAWFFAPLTPDLRPWPWAATAIGTVLWFGTALVWADHVWHRWPSPVWPHIWVVSHMTALVIAGVVAVVRACGALS